MTWPALVWEAAPKALLYAALLPALGALVARWALLPALSGVLSAAARARVEQLLGQIGLGAALLALLATALRAWTHTIAAFGFADAQSWETIRIIAFESRWGSAWVLQLAAAVLLFLSYLVVRVSPRAGWVLAAASGASMCVALPLLGHAAGSVGRMAIHTAHLLGAGLWIGTLAALWMVARVESSGRPGAVQEIPEALFRQFSTIALSGSALLLVAGLFASALYIQTPSSLFTTPYGRALLAKTTLVAAIGACGFTNWRRFADSSSGRGAIPSTVPLEVALALAVVLTTAVLTELEH